MKKRSFDEPWLFQAYFISIFGLFGILAFAFRAVTLPGSYGVVPLEIPVVQAPIDDPGYNQFKEDARDAISHTTPAVVLTTEAFFFGDLAAFTTNFSDVRDKYIIRHVAGEPQLPQLVKQLTDWMTQRAHNENIPLSKILVVIPANDIPAPILIQVIAGLRSSPHFQRVILSNGII
jgi:hypothetical protein